MAAFRICRTCKKHLPDSSFRTIRRAQYVNKALDCRQCESARNNARNKERKAQGDPRIAIASKRKRCRYYGLTLEDFDGMVWLQDNKCAICARPDPNHIDHNHTTGKVRGILCSQCNTGLGLFGDDAARMNKAILYLGVA